MEKALIIDASLCGAAMALVARKDNKILGRQTNPSPRGTSRDLAQMFKELCGQDPHDISLLAVSVGPGSFTGIKVGLAFTQGLGLALRQQSYLALSGLEAAACHLAQDSDLALFRPITRSHGFLACVRHGVLTAPAYLVERGQLCLEINSWRTCGPSRFLMASSLPSWLSLEGCELSPEHLDEKSLVEGSLSGMIAQVSGLRDWHNEARIIPPRPDYRRATSAEERMGAVCEVTK